MQEKTMYGFLAGFFGDDSVCQKLGAAQSLGYKNFMVFYNPLPKFEKDHLFYQDDTRIVLLDGVILNKLELLNFHGKQDWKEVFDLLISLHGNSFMDNLIGSFRGFVYDKATDKICVFTNHDGNKTVFYTELGGTLVFASHNDLIFDALTALGIHYELSLPSAYEMLSYGYLLHGKTPAENVFRLMPANFLLWENGATKIGRYHVFSCFPQHSQSIEELLKEFDTLFRNSINRLFAKNTEYGYRSAADLSGGIDSRMVNWVAKDLGYKDILNICLGVTGTLEHKIAQKVASDLGHEFYFHVMDHGEMMLDTEEMVYKFGGQMFYAISGGANRALNQIDTENIGVYVMGLAAEIVKGKWVPGVEHIPPKGNITRHSTFLDVRFPEEALDYYEGEFQLALYEWDLCSVVYTSIMHQDRVEVSSPFLAPEMIDFCIKVPLIYQKHYHFIVRWITEYYPDAAKYVWQLTGKPVGKKFYFPKMMDDIRSFFIRVFNKAMLIVNIPKRVPLSSDRLPTLMWYCNEKTVRTFMTDYFNNHIHLVKNPELKKAMTDLFEKRPEDKMQVLSLLAEIKRCFSND